MLYNENYVMPPAAQGVEEGVLQGLYRSAVAPEGPSTQATLIFSGSAQKGCPEAAEDLAHGITT